MSSLKWPVVLKNLTKLTPEENNKIGDRPFREYLALGCFQEENKFYVSGNSL